MSTTSKTTTRVVEEHFDQEGQLTSRITTDTVEEFTDGEPDKPPLRPVLSDSIIAGQWYQSWPTGDSTQIRSQFPGRTA